MRLHPATGATVPTRERLGGLAGTADALENRDAAARYYRSVEAPAVDGSERDEVREAALYPGAR